MASVCKWLSFYLCLRDSPKFIKDTKGELHMYDAIIVWKGSKIESPKESKSGVAYDVILAPASSKETTPRPNSPPKERPLSQEIIEKKLKEAEERRQSMEQAKLQNIAKQKERAQEAAKKVEELNESFSKETEKKMAQRLESMEEKKDKQLKALQDRLKEHANRVDAVRKKSEQTYAELKARSEAKMASRKENRDARIAAVLERARIHDKHIQEVVESCNKLKEEVSKCMEEKMIRKMNTTLQNREDQLRQLIEKQKEHDRHAEEVRKNREIIAAAGDSAEATS